MRATVLKDWSRPKPFLGAIGDRATAKSHPWYGISFQNELNLSNLISYRRC